MVSQIDAKYVEKFGQLATKTIVEQGKWFLNGFWDEMKGEAENIWNFANKMGAQNKKGKHGCDLDEFESHKFLESLGETLTIIELRDRLRTIDLDSNNRMAMVEYLIFKYKRTVAAVCDAPQSENKAEIDAAQNKVEHASTAMAEMQTRLAEQQKALAEQESAEADARKAESENVAALEELKKQEDEYNGKKSHLEEETKQPGVKGAKAVQELAALKGEDPLPLRKAKITQEATVRKAEKMRREAEAKTAQCQEATRQVEAAVKDAEQAYQDAVESLQITKQKGGSSSGDIWWMERDMQEVEKYLPKKKK